jgi:lipase
MLGGGVYGARMFAPHAKDLSSEFDVIRVQTLNVQLAASGAPMPPTYSVETEAEAVEQTLATLGVEGPVDLVGASFGAVIALRFAVANPGRVRTLTLFEPPVFWALTDEDYARYPVAQEMRELTVNMTPDSTPSDRQFERFRCLLGSCPPAIPADTDPDRAEWDIGRRAMRGLASVPRHRESIAGLAQLDCPVLLLTGSTTVPFHRQMADRLAPLLPDVSRAEVTGGHSAPRTAITEFAETLRQFLRQH